MHRLGDGVLDVVVSVGGRGSSAMTTLLLFTGHLTLDGIVPAVVGFCGAWQWVLRLVS